MKVGLNEYQHDAGECHNRKIATLDGPCGDPRCDPDGPAEPYGLSMEPKLVAVGGYWAEGAYVSYEINRYDWGAGAQRYIRDSWINGRWVSCSRGHNLNDMMPEGDQK